MGAGSHARRARAGRTGVLVVLATGLGLAGCLPPSPPPPTIAVYGDSLVAESEAVLRVYPTARPGVPYAPLGDQAPTP